MKNIFILTLILFSAYTGFSQNNAGFFIASPGERAQIILNENEEDLVHIASGMLADDIKKVSGQLLELTGSGNSKYQIKIGTVGRDDDFDRECKQAGIDINKFKKQWEAYHIKTVISPTKNILFVVGSNSRGTAYGLMELSRMIGVSPWIWWADVQPEKNKTISLPGNLDLSDAPRVKFRGIFLNDEDWGLQPWAAKNFEPETGDIGPKTYEKIFELLLRLKANTIWPAMHPCTKAFYTIPGNKEVAAKYQIFVGTSHAEPMLRNNVDEWDRKLFGEYNYSVNSENIKDYWLKRIEELSADDKYIVTLGMRGIHDSGMQGNYTSEQKVKLLETIISDQRGMLKSVLKKDISDIPQAFVPYKEVLDIYKEGAQVPDDVTLIWPDDNHGYVRQLSDADERKRSGGAGVYYHISYWGRPHDFLWLESVPVSLIWEEMHKAYQTNARNIWIVNVGDIKPMEIGMNFFLEMAWNPERFSPENLDAYYTRFAESQFGKQYAVEIGEILKKYFQLGFSRKPEHMGWNTISPTLPIQGTELSLFQNGDELQQRINAYDKLEKQVEKLYQEIPAYRKDAFYELVAYKVIGASNMNKKILYAYKSRVYAAQERTSANLYAQKAKTAFEKIEQITAFYNDTLASGKWQHMMTYNPRRLPVFDMPKTSNYKPEKPNKGEILPEGYSAVVNESEIYALPTFNSLTKRSYFVDVFNSGIQALKWQLETSDDWVVVSRSSGETDTEERIWVSVDWTKITSQDTVHSKILFKLNNQEYVVNISAIKPDWPVTGANFFVEDNGVVAIEAEHFSKQNKTEAGTWTFIKSLGRISDAMGTFPVTAKTFSLMELNAAPTLSYDFYSSSTGNASLHFYCIPTLPLNDDYQLRFAVIIDDGEPLVVNAALKEEMDEHNGEWKSNVLNAVTIQKIQTMIAEKGKHTLQVKMMDPGVVLDKMELVFEEPGSSYFGVPETIVTE
nr:glycosyl hydrolase 115 family protein [uncultured Draconibacterium sp.]